MRVLFSSSITRGLVGLVLVAATVGAFAIAPAPQGPARTYLVLYSGHTEAASAQRSIELAGGGVGAVYGAIGMAFAKSGDATFTSRMRQVPGVVGVARTDRHVWHLPPGSN